MFTPALFLTSHKISDISDFLKLQFSEGLSPMTVRINKSTILTVNIVSHFTLIKNKCIDTYGGTLVLQLLW